MFEEIIVVLVFAFMLAREWLFWRKLERLEDLLGRLQRLRMPVIELGAGKPAETDERVAPTTRPDGSKW